MATYNTSEFRKGLKVQIDGDPYLMIECNFVKPGKGQALYKCKLRNLLRGTVLDRTYKSGDSLEAADIEEIQAQFLYRQRRPVRLHGQRDLRAVRADAEQVDDAWKYLKEGMVCSMVLFNNKPDQHDAAQPRGAEGRVLRAGRARATRPPTSPSRAKVETGAEILCPAFVEIGDLIKIDTRTGEYIERVKE